jgi:pimeloyl-ACP methyl ester carboxylesterase
MLALALAPVAAAQAAQAAQPPVVQRQITITDPQLGPLTFDALASGDPAAARTGRLVLLLHGFPETDESFRAVLPALAAAGYYAVAPSQRGYSPGARPADVSDYDLLDLSGDALRMASALGAWRFHLVGHDWGGAVTWVTAALAPYRLSSIAVLSTPHPDALAEADADPDGTQKSMLGYLNLVTIPGIQYGMLAAGPGGLAVALELMGMPDSYATTYANQIGTPDALGAALDWYRANPIPSPITLGPISVPTLYMWGSKDFALSREAADDTAQFVHAPYTYDILDGVNHFVPETATAQVTQAVLQQLAQTS